MSDDNVIPFPVSAEQREADERSDFFFVVSFYFKQNFESLFKGQDNVTLYMALFTLAEILKDQIEKDNAFVSVNENSEELHLAMIEGLHEELETSMKELANVVNERETHDIH